jgi:alcohol dehydrogenase
MTVRCQAAVLRTIGAPHPYAQSKPLSIEEVNLAPPRPIELLVRIAGAGLCHSDLSVINGNRPLPLPIVLGHEGSGEIVEIGSAIDDVRAGDHVVFQFSASCGRCRRRLEGRPQVCERARVAKAAGELMAGGGRLTGLNGERIGHHSGCPVWQSTQWSIAEVWL